MRIKIHYPFHPLYGRELETTCKPKKNNGRFTVVDPKGKKLKIPSWMLSANAEKFHLSKEPVIDARFLLQLAILLKYPENDETVESNNNSDTLSSSGKSLRKRGKHETDVVRGSSQASTRRANSSTGSDNTAKIDLSDGGGNYSGPQRKRRKK